MCIDPYTLPFFPFLMEWEGKSPGNEVIECSASTDKATMVFVVD